MCSTSLIKYVHGEGNKRVPYISEKCSIHDGNGF